MPCKHWPDCKRLKRDSARLWGQVSQIYGQYAVRGSEREQGPHALSLLVFRLNIVRVSSRLECLESVGTIDSVGPISRPTIFRQAPQSLRVGGQFGPSQFHDPALSSSGRTHGFTPSALSSLCSTAAVLPRMRDPGLLLSSSHDQTYREQPRTREAHQCHGPSSSTR